MKNLIAICSLAIALFAWSPVFGQAAGGGDPLEGFGDLVESQSGPREPTGSGQTGSGTQSGGGETANSINANWLGFTKLVPVDTRLEWTAPAAVTAFQVSLGPDDASGDVIFKMETTNKSVVLPLSQLNLKSGKDYMVQISSANGTNKSPRYGFSVLPQSELKSALENLKEDDRFKNASEDHRILMKAFVLENLELYSQALEMYKTFRHSDESDTLFRNMRDRFLERLAEQQ